MFRVRIVFVLVFAAAVAGGLWWVAELSFLRGQRVAEHRHLAENAARQARLMQLAERLSRAESERLEAEEARDDLAREMDGAARNDVNSARPALGLDGVRRLNRR
ncbi:MAG: hypothetical protein RLZZ528_2250 [Pseudomonadota bacterium]|jgi:hypothetical protein